MPILCGNANAQNASNNASQSGRRISMNCGKGDTLSNNPMANVSQTTQPFLARVPTISASPFVWSPPHHDCWPGPRRQALRERQQAGLRTAWLEPECWPGTSHSAPG
ncbi:hypothetical protein D9M73_195770 [compost metagenome]